MINYNFLQKILHDIYLKNKFIKKSLYELEKIFFLRKKNNELDLKNHVFITGLPRSGTTSLLNFLFMSGNFASLTYANTPFIMATNLASKIFSKSKIEKRERFHKDGIFHDLNSPESFDEVFFSTFSEKEADQELQNFISLILTNKKKERYLSKNNLHYKRINFLQNKFKNSIFLIPFRDPLQQSYSLLNQHNIFTKLQTENKFLRRYMSYFGHNEFGIDHKSWNMPNNYKNFNQFNYWLEQWVLFYEDIFLRFSNNANCFFICYEKLNQDTYVKEISNKVLMSAKVNFTFNCQKKSIIDSYDKKLYDKAIKIYNIINSNV